MRIFASGPYFFRAPEISNPRPYRPAPSPARMFTMFALTTRVRALARESADLDAGVPAVREPVAGGAGFARRFGGERENPSTRLGICAARRSEQAGAHRGGRQRLAGIDVALLDSGATQLSHLGGCRTEESASGRN